MVHPRSRRLVLKVLAAAPAALVLASARAARADDAQCVVQTDDGLPEALGFVAPAPDPNRACRTCTFWTADQSGACGRCQMMMRSTPANGVCNSWASH